MKYEVERFIKLDCEIGEVPIWDEDSGKFYFIDILKNHIHIYEPAGDTTVLKTIDVGQNIGCIALRENGGLIAGLVDGIYAVDERTGEKEFLLNPEQHIENNRFNDGKCDPAGRLWIGSMSRTLDSGFGDYVPRGALYCMEADCSITKKVDDVTISNGLAWNKAKDTFYYIDSPTKTVSAFDYNLETADIDNRRVVLDFAGVEGIPDGMCIDAEDNLWIAFFGGAAVRYCDPRKGEVIAEVKLPALSIACTAFGGEGYRDLLVTTGLANTDPAKHPDAGSVFKIRTDVPGMATPKFKG